MSVYLAQEWEVSALLKGTMTRDEILFKETCSRSRCRGSEMKSAFLILYLWHAGSFTITSGGGANGGPVLQIVPMPSLTACEVVGKAAKALADTTRPNQGEGAMQSQSASYRCVEVSK